MAGGTRMNPVVKGFVLPGLPHLVLTPDANPGWKKVRQAMDTVKAQIEATDADVIMIYSTYWPSVIGHQINSRALSEWVHVDDQFHDLGSIPYKIKGDPELAKAYVSAAKARNLEARAIDYHGFPIDTGSVVVSKLVNPNNRIPTVIVSSNVYSDRAETLILGKAGRDALMKQNKKAVAVIVTSLSNRIHEKHVEPKDDHIHSLKDQEWNLKFLEFLKEGRLEDASQLSRQFHKEARVNKVANFKPFWWLASIMGQSNLYAGDVLEYQPIYGSGAAVISLTPSSKAARDLEFDEADPEKYAGERNVLGGGEPMAVMDTPDDADLEIENS
jgi:2-aminophenol/2-amino-5-chlorophenol 1,6-dioxygenase alpha subunit